MTRRTPRPARAWSCPTPVGEGHGWGCQCGDRPVQTWYGIPVATVRDISDYRNEQHMSNHADFQDRGDAARRAAGIDGTAGDAQDIRHRFIADEPDGGCLLCGLGPRHRQHIDRPLACGYCYEEQGEEVHPHPECPVSGDPDQ